jgi:hypothetical protein
MSRVFRPPSSAASPGPSYSILRGERDALFWKHASSFTVRRAGQGDDNIVSLHFNHSGRLLRLGLLRRCLPRRCRRWRLRSRLLTTSAHDGPTNNGEDNHDGGCNPNFGFLTRRNDPGEKFDLLSPGEQALIKPSAQNQMLKPGRQSTTLGNGWALSPTRPVVVLLVQASSSASANGCSGDRKTT